jgi:hypothetical protein
VVVAITLPRVVIGEVVIVSIEHPAEGVSWAKLFDNYAIGWLVDEAGEAQPAPLLIGTRPLPATPSDIASPSHSRQRTGIGSFDKDAKHHARKPVEFRYNPDKRYPPGHRGYGGSAPLDVVDRRLPDDSLVDLVEKTL